MNFQRHGVETLRQLTELIATPLRNRDGLHACRLLLFDALGSQQKVFKGLLELPDEIPRHGQSSRAAQHHHGGKYKVAPLNNGICVGVCLLAQTRLLIDGGGQQDTDIACFRHIEDTQHFSPDMLVVSGLAVCLGLNHALLKVGKIFLEHVKGVCVVDTRKAEPVLAQQLGLNSAQLAQRLNIGVQPDKQQIARR